MPSLDRRAFFKTASAASAIAVVTVASAPRVLAQATTQAPEGPFKLAPLPYTPAALEPHIDAMTMEIHHGKHHVAYVNNLNNALKDYAELAKLPLEDILAKIAEVPEAVRTALRNNGGGHANHTMFWSIMGPAGGPGPDGELKAAIDRDFGGIDKLQETFNTAGTKVFGSGWVFVTVDKAGKLALATKPNQDTPLMEGARVLIGNDVWEHAYYLKYQNKRADYLKAWWNVVDWKAVSGRYAAAKAGTLKI